METEKSSQTESDKQTDTDASVSAETIPNSEKPKKSKRKTMKEKWKDLIREKRSWKTRLLISLLVSLSFAYTLTVFGPFELYLPNMSYFTFSFLDMAPSMILVGIGVTAGLTLILMLLRGKFFTYIASAVFSTTVCAYVQGNFLNQNWGSLDGTPIQWESMALTMLGNFAIWAAIFIIPYIVSYFKPKMWRRMLIFLSALLIAMQSVAMVTLLVRNDFIEIGRAHV